MKSTKQKTGPHVALAAQLARTGKQLEVAEQRTARWGLIDAATSLHGAHRLVGEAVQRLHDLKPTWSPDASAKLEAGASVSLREKAAELYADLVPGAAKKRWTVVQVGAQRVLVQHEGISLAVPRGHLRTAQQEGAA